MPSSKQTRRSISVRGTTYDTLRRFCQDQSRSMSDVVEEQLARLLTAKPITAKPITAKPIIAKPITARPAARPQRTVAPKIVRAPAPPVVSNAVGRPAPVPAREIVQPRVDAPKDDYRNIDF